MEQKFIAYYRKSVPRKDKNGKVVKKEDDYSIEFQRRECEKFAKSKGGVVIAEFSEIASGRNDARIEVAKAVDMCKQNNATLIVAKFSRFMRSLSFLVKIRDSKIKFTAIDLQDANELTISIFAVFAEYQAKETSAFVKSTLGIAREIKGKEWRVNNLNDSGRRKAAQTKLAKWNDPKYKMLKQFCESLKKQGMTYHEIAWKVRQSAFAPILPFATADKIGALLRREIAA